MAFDIDNEELYIKSEDTLHKVSTRERLYKKTLTRVLPPQIQVTAFAVDYASRNVYFTTKKGTSMNVCDRNGLCLPYTARRKEVVSRIQIARLAKSTRVFWQEGSRIMSGSLDGSEIRQVFKALGGEPIHYFLVDEQSEKMYVALMNLVEVNLETTRTRLLAKLDFDLFGNMLWNMAVHDDVVLVQVAMPKSTPSRKSMGPMNRIYQIDRLTGDHLQRLEAPPSHQLHSVRRRSKTPMQNPCSRNSCSHVCAPDSSLASYKCLCPPGMHLDDGDKKCIPQEGEEMIFFVNGTSASTYVFEDDELYITSNFDLKVKPVAIATTLDMNLVFSSHQKIYEVKKDGSTKSYPVRGVRSMVLDPIDDVLYAVNEYELVAVNLKTSEVALIRDDVNLKHLDIDPLNR